MSNVNIIIDKIKDRGLKITPQRVKILELLEGRKDHPTAEKIFEDIKKIFPTISFTTVYNTLEMLSDLGEIQELTIDYKKKHFDPDTSGHHHFLCLTCNKITDIFTDFKIKNRALDSLGKTYEISKYSVDFYGTCENCVSDGKK